MIKLQVIGNLGKDCLVNNVNSKNVINFSVCHTEKFKDAQGNQRDKSIWVECSYWTDRTGIAPYLKKGTMVYVEGQPEVRNFTAKDGSQGSSLSLRVLSVQLLGGGNRDQQPQSASNNNQPAYSQPSYSANEITEPDDSLPF